MIREFFTFQTFLNNEIFVAQIETFFAIGIFSINKVWNRISFCFNRLSWVWNWRHSNTHNENMLNEEQIISRILVSYVYVPPQKYMLWVRLCCQFHDGKSRLKLYNHEFHYPNRLEKSFPYKSRFLKDKISLNKNLRIFFWHLKKNSLVWILCSEIIVKDYCNEVLLYFLILYNYNGI